MLANKRFRRAVATMTYYVLPAFFLIFPFPATTGNPLSAGRNWDPGLLHTARDAGYLSDREKEVILEINKLRSDPSGYAVDYLEPLINCYQGNLLLLAGKVRIKTKEGSRALSDAIRFLKKTPPAPLLMPDLKLTLASRDHVKDQAAKGGTGHTGNDGSGAQSRIRRYGQYSRAVGENIFYGEENPRMVVIHLLIDDGQPGRGHRLNLLDRDYRLIGVAMGNHPSWKHICVIDLVDSMK